MEIKKSLDPHNKLLVSWKNGGDPCGGTFAGVACNDNRKVANISLQGKGLTGKVPPAVAELKCLSGLYLHYNFLTGQIPVEIAKLTELTDLYLNFNNLTGIIPSQIGTMTGLQVLQLGYNKLTGSIPTEIGLLKNLNFLALESNKLTGQIPDSLGNLNMLKTLYLSYNQLSGSIPVALAKTPSLQALHVQNNTLSGLVPLGFQRLNNDFQFQNNPGLCGTGGISTLRACTPFDNVNVNLNSSSTNRSGPTNIPRSATFPLPCNQSKNNCSKPSSKLPQIGIVAGVITLTVALTVVVFFGIVKYRRQKQKVGNKSDISREDRLSMDPANDSYKRNPSAHHVALEVSSGWDPANGALDRNGSHHASQQGSNNKFNMEEVESATHHFSEANLLGKSKFSAVYKGILKDGSITAIKSINRTSRKSEEDEFLKGLSLLNSMKHENLVELKGFCCSKARGECFLVYDFAPRGSLSRYLDAEDGSIDALDWPTRVSIIHGIAKGIEYLHSNETTKPPIVHQNISVEKVLLDQQYRPLISDAGLLKLLADDVVYSALKVSAALGYMAPEYITTGRFTEKSDVYAYGVIIFQVLCGRTKLPGTTRIAAESGKFEEFIDSKLDGEFSETEATRLTKIALKCTNEIPEKRPSIGSIVRELNDPKGG
ncbi:protein nsp-interacting kinase 2 [Phtheirospermum japonicum]|uniref:Protein nsp-interacting kinase 2 n=1 Tax=Phtheirospermum japonicum TaxID=374723 RepID=A0A830B4K8_9LAMI|nr:protein nsp-interacting kinase 2 [Phtheirospermum japonicum]